MGGLPVAAGLGNIADSGYGLYSNVVYAYRALNGSIVYLPSGGFSWAADTISPGSQSAQDMAQVASLALALGSGRVKVGTTLQYGDSALAYYTPATISGMLNANVVKPTGSLESILIPTATPGASTASTALDTVQHFQLGNVYYDYFYKNITTPQQGKK